MRKSAWLAALSEAPWTPTRGRAPGAPTVVRPPEHQQGEERLARRTQRGTMDTSKGKNARLADRSEVP
jgi:hypothetical protein